MARIKSVNPEETNPEVKAILQQFEKKMGHVPNIFLNLANSPAALKGYLALNSAVEQTTLSPTLREQLALVVGQTNNCQYCLSAHTAGAKGLGLEEEGILQARHGEAKDPKSQEILKFAQKVVNNRGNISNQDIAALKAAGVTDTELAEITLVITINLFTNYFNLITDPKIDFPLAPDLS